MNPLPAPAYYKLKSRKLSFIGLVRMRGWWRAPLAWLITRFKDMGTYTWVPTTWDETTCDRQELSPRCREITAEHQEQLARLGFTELGCRKSRNVLNRVTLDNGGIHYLDASHTQQANIGYVKSRVPPPVNQVREKVIVSFTAIYPDGSLLNHTDNQSPFDSLPHHEVVRHKTHDAAKIHRAFAADLERRGTTPRQFPDRESLRAWYDALHLEIFTTRVASGLYVKATDAEIARAYRRIPNPTFPPPLPSASH